MGRIILTGDLHGGFARLTTFNEFNKDLTKEDVVIVLGDFGVIWKDAERTKEILEIMGQRFNFTLAFVDGNHENFELIREMEEISYWNNGYIGKLPGGIIHLLRGEIYNIADKKVGVCGGANSVDLWHRKEHESWWKEEDITQVDLNNFKQNLAHKTDNNKIDLMLTHTCPAAILPQVALYSVANGTNVPVRNCEAKLEEINQLANIDKWFFGHWHIDMRFDNKFECLYRVIKEV